MNPVKQRPFWTGFGLATHALFAVTVYYLYFYLRGDDEALPAASGESFAWASFIDSMLAIQFAVSHSWLLHPATRRRFSGLVPQPAYGVFFCTSTCLSLLLTIACWQPMGGAVWQLKGTELVAMRAAFIGAWLALLYSLHLAGIGYQTGWTTWWPWIRGRTVAKREFQPRSLFLWFRHPVYLSFLGLIWLTPVMSWDRAVLTFWWTIYIFVGSYLKDRRLEHYLGDAYRAYQSQVPGYPGVLIGPLGKVSRSAN